MPGGAAFRTGFSGDDESAGRAALGMRETAFNEPHRWARRAVGPLKQYRLFKIQVFTTAFAIIAIALALSKDAPKTPSWWIMFGSMCVFVLTGVVWTPLMLLFSLRAHLAPGDAERGFEVTMSRDDGSAAQ